MMTIAPNSPRLAARFGTNRVVAFGLVCVAGAMFLFTISRIDTSYWALLPVMMTMAGGMAMVIPSMTGSIMSAVPLGKAGVGSAMNDTTRELGGALGVAVLGSLVASRYTSRLEPAIALVPEELRGKANESLAGALQAATSMQGSGAGSSAAEVNRIAREAYVSGVHLAAIVAGSVVLVASMIVYRQLPAGNPHAQGAAAH
jgi:hypothetical protein